MLPRDPTQAAAPRSKRAAPAANPASTESDDPIRPARRAKREDLPEAQMPGHVHSGKRRRAPRVNYCEEPDGDDDSGADSDYDAAEESKEDSDDEFDITRHSDRAPAPKKSATAKKKTAKNQTKLTVLGAWVRPLLHCLWPSDVLSASLVCKEFARIGRQHPVWAGYGEFLAKAARIKADPAITLPRAYLKMWRPSWERPLEHFQLVTKKAEVGLPLKPPHFCPRCLHYSVDDDHWSDCAMCISENNISRKFYKNESRQRFKLNRAQLKAAGAANARQYTIKQLDDAAAGVWGSLDAAMAPKMRELHRDIAKRDLVQQRERVLASLQPARTLAPKLLEAFEKGNKTAKLEPLRAICEHGAFLERFTQATGKLEDVLHAYAEPHVAKTEEQFAEQLRRDGFPTTLRLKAVKAGRRARLMHHLKAADAATTPEALQHSKLCDYVLRRRGGTAEAVVADLLRSRRDALLAELRRRNVPESATATDWIQLRAAPGEEVERVALELTQRYRRARVITVDRLLIYERGLKAWVAGEGTEAADDVLPAAKQRVAQRRADLQAQWSDEDGPLPESDFRNELLGERETAGAVRRWRKRALHWRMYRLNLGSKCDACDAYADRAISMDEAEAQARAEHARRLAEIRERVLARVAVDDVSPEDLGDLDLKADPWVRLERPTPPDDWQVATAARPLWVKLTHAALPDGVQLTAVKAASKRLFVDGTTPQEAARALLERAEEHQATAAAAGGELDFNSAIDGTWDRALLSEGMRQVLSKGNLKLIAKKVFGIDLGGVPKAMARLVQQPSRQPDVARIIEESVGLPVSPAELEACEIRALNDSQIAHKLKVIVVEREVAEDLQPLVPIVVSAMPDKRAPEVIEYLNAQPVAERRAELVAAGVPDVDSRPALHFVAGLTTDVEAVLFQPPAGFESGFDVIVDALQYSKGVVDGLPGLVVTPALAQEYCEWALRESRTWGYNHFMVGVRDVQRRLASSRSEVPAGFRAVLDARANKHPHRWYGAQGDCLCWGCV